MVEHTHRNIDNHTVSVISMSSHNVDIPVYFPWLGYSRQTIAESGWRFIWLTIGCRCCCCWLSHLLLFRWHNTMRRPFFVCVVQCVSSLVTSRKRKNCSPGKRDEEMILLGFDDDNARITFALMLPFNEMRKQFFSFLGGKWKHCPGGKLPVKVYRSFIFLL